MFKHTDVVWPASATDNAIARFDSTTWKLIQDSWITIDDLDNILDAWTINAYWIQLDTITWWHPHSTWLLHWNADEDTAELWMVWTEVKLQIGQELLLPLSKAIWSNINNWQVVYIEWAWSSKPRVSLAKADAMSTTSWTIAVATEDVLQNASWYFTNIWVVRGIDTSAFTDWDTLYLSATVAWWITNVTPEEPNFVTKIWYCMLSHPSTWAIFVSINQRSNVAKHIKLEDSADYIAVFSSTDYKRVILLKLRRWFCWNSIGTKNLPAGRQGWYWWNNISMKLNYGRTFVRLLISNYLILLRLQPRTTHTNLPWYHPFWVN